MNGGCVSLDRILGKLDEYLHKNDYSAAERHLLYWHAEAKKYKDLRTLLPVGNELMGLYRKLGRANEAITAAEDALAIVAEYGVGEQVGAATTYLNAATVYKAFGNPERSLALFLEARRIYERELDPEDERLGGLYNNMGLTLVDLCRYEEAQELYRLALSVMEAGKDGAPEQAITYLNMASAKEAELGLLEADEEIAALLDRAEELLEGVTNRDGGYAFVCEKCASVFGYYGRFAYEKELTERARRIYGI